MIRCMRDVDGYSVYSAKDEDVGKITDMLFDGSRWVIRYFVVDIGDWLTNRQILISPLAITHLGSSTMHLNLDKELIERSPKLDQNKPITLQFEEELYRHYSWPFYWDHEQFYNLEPIPLVESKENPAVQFEVLEEMQKKGNQSAYKQDLRSMHDMIGYEVAATDIKSGSISDCVADTQEWLLRYFVVNIRTGLSSKEVLISVEWISAIDWLEGIFHLSHSSKEVQASPVFDPRVPINREYEERLYDYYGRPRYWAEDSEP